MSDLLRMTGMYSGMDTQSIVTQLVEARSKKVDTLKNEQTKLEWKQNVWQDLNSKIYSLYSGTLSKLRLTSAYSKKSTVSSDTTKATIVASDSAVNGTQTLKINHLAKSGYLTGAELAKKKKTETDEDGNETVKEVDWTGDDKLSEMNSALVGKTINITVGQGEDAKLTGIEITNDMTISGFVNKLKEAGVNASFDEENQRFFISSTKTGKANEFELSAGKVGENTSVLSVLGLDATVKDSGCTRIKAQDAEIELNGATFTSDSNTFSVNGLTINALGETDGEISVVTSTDYEGVYDTIKDFISEYNELIVEMDKLYNADSARDYDVLSDEEKESMTDDEIEKWEDKIKGSLLRKDGNLSSVMNALKSTMMEGFYLNNLTDKEKESMSEAEIEKWYADNGKKRYLSDFGIKTKNYFDCEENEHYAYHIDGDEDDEYSSTNQDKLKAAIAADPEGTAEFFASLCKKLYSKLDETMGETTTYSSIYKVYNDKQLKKDYDNYTKKIKEAEQELSDYEDKWYDKFAAMEVALSKLQSNSSAVTSMLGM
ncbi:MAG: flagellar filament capping protein FliD [Lachnospiraceae bacterium]|nr:flagellar filament capping protein FliD [Lachnospiraceae bacterium]